MPDWVCDECKTGDTSKCCRPEYCAAAREKREEWFDILRKERMENGWTPKQPGKE